MTYYTKLKRNKQEIIFSHLWSSIIFILAFITLMVK